MELTIAVLMISILSLGAFLSYLRYTDEAKIVACRKDFRHLREALRLYNEDHFQTPYSLNDASALYGRYLSSVPKDPWFSEYVIDPFLGRVLSRGPNGTLETPVVGIAEPVSAETAVDDLVATYSPLGLISFAAGSEARAVLIEEAIQMFKPLTGIEAFGALPDRETALVAMAGKLRLAKDLLASPVLDDIGGSPAQLDTLSVSPLGRRYAAVTADKKSLWIGPVTAGQEPAFNLFTSSGPTLSAPAWSRDEQEIAVSTSEGELWRIVVGAGAQKTVLTRDVVADTVKGAPSWSPDGKWIAYAAAAGGKIHRISPTAVKTATAVDVSTFAGSPGPVAWSPDGQKLGVVSGSSLHVVAVSEPSKLHLDVTTNQPYNAQDARGLTWR